MKKAVIRKVVKGRFAVTSREKASDQAREAMEEYVRLVEKVGTAVAMRPVRVPAMLGVDEDMREWSLCMILEHNVIVNHRITPVVRALALGEDVPANEDFDPKKDVMPSASPGMEQVTAFRESVEHHIATVAELPELKGTAKTVHPVFGPFDAHQWHCMFAFHLDIHLRQAKAVARLAG
jgi:hypothetical protein